MDVDNRITSSLAGRYAVKRELGRGGMATVFLARDVRHRRQVAVKVLRPDIASAVGADRFLFEVETASRLTHPHILPLLDSGDADGLLYYVMPYVEGESLRDRLGRERQLPVADAVRIACDVASALDYAHRCDIVHRDIKPENILLEDGHAVVADFGIARAISSAGDNPEVSGMHAARTATGVALGTPAYMSPEQASAERELDGRSDIYSLGCVLYEMLAGEPPFTGPTAESVVRQHLTVTAPAVTSVRPAVSTGVAEAVSRALEKTPADRFATAAEFAEALRSGGEGRAQGGGAGRIPEAAQTSGRRRRVAIGSFGLVVLLIIGVAAWAAQDRPRDDAPAPADTPVRRAYTIVASVEGTADSADRAAARTLLVTALDQSNTIVSLPDEQIRLGLASAGSNATLPLDALAAREIAIRGEISTLIAPSIDRVGDTYHVSVRMLDAKSGTAIITEREIAHGSNDLIPTIDRVVTALRGRIGERRDAVGGSPELRWVATPSLEAFLLFHRAGELGRKRDHTAAIAGYRQALVVDPDFAAAWHSLGVSLWNLGLGDSAALAWREAERRPHRLTLADRLHVTGLLAYSRDDLVGAAESWGQLHRMFGGSANNLGFVLDDLDRTREAVALMTEWERDSRFGLPPGARANFANWLAATGQFSEARRQVSGLTPNAMAEVAIQLGAWAEAESLAIGVIDTLTRPTRLRGNMIGVLASAAAVRGRIHESFTHLRQRRAISIAQRDMTFAPTTLYQLLALSMASGIPLTHADAAAGEAIGSIRGDIAVELTHAVAGDTAVRSTGPASRRRIRPDTSAFSSGARHLILAAKARARGDLEGVKDALGPHVRRARLHLNPGSQIAYWMHAESFEESGQPDSAIVWFQALLDITQIAALDQGHIGFGLTHSFAHFRLARIHADRGDRASSRKHANEFLDAFREPDPEFKWMVAEAQRLAAAN